MEGNLLTSQPVKKMDWFTETSGNLPAAKIRPWGSSSQYSQHGYELKPWHPDGALK